MSQAGAPEWGNADAVEVEGVSQRTFCASE